MERRSTLLTTAVAALLAWGACCADASGRTAPPSVMLAEDGRAIQPIVVGVNAAPATRASADELARYLSRISGAAFRVEVGEGKRGLAVGVRGDFPDVKLDIDLETADPLRRDEYLLRSHARGVHLIGASETAVTLAVWDLLHRLGYRLYFLTDTWEIVPERSDLRIAVDTVERPDFVTRLAPRGAPWSDRDLWDRWRRRNRVLSSFHLDTGHSYGRIIGAKREEFAKHPEYFALVEGKRRHPGDPDWRGSIKFCISNPGLRKLVVDYAVESIRAEPQRECISLDPSDGGDWCQCKSCAAMGSVSDRVVLLAGEAAEAINGLGLGPKYVGIYAYNQHSPPPQVEVHPRVIVSVATSFIRGGYTLDELVEGWRARGATLGIREYHDVFAWSHDRVRKARGGDIAHLGRTIPDFYKRGARFMNSENSDSWGANGLGFWLTPQLLWDVDATQRVNDLVEDFLRGAFGPAAPPMREFYELLNRDDTVRSDRDVIARMYRRLDEARRLTDDPKIGRRLDDLVLYTRYLELYRAYRRAQGSARQQAFERVWRHAYRIRDRRLISTRAICERDRFRDKSVDVPDEAAWNVPADRNPWKSEEPFEEQEIAAILAVGIAANEPTELDFEPVEYSDQLVPATALKLPEVKASQRPERFRGRQAAYTWLPHESPEDAQRPRRRIELGVTGGLIVHYRDRGNVEFALHAGREATLEPVDEDRSVPPDGQARTVVLKSRHGGLHRVSWNDGNDMTRIVWPAELPLTFRSTSEEPLRLTGRWSLYFYVPRGTRTVGGFATATTGRMLDGRGKVVFSFDEMREPDYFSVTVPKGQDGTLWRLENCTGARMLLTTPPYLAASAEDLLLPREVVALDAAR